MKTARVSFGCSVDNYGEKIYAIGGTLAKQDPTNVCEYYNVIDDTWTDLPPLPEKRFSSSLCIFNDEYLFSFGGY